MTPSFKPSAHDPAPTVLASTPGFRDLRVVIDDVAFPLDLPPGWNWQALLAGLLTHANVKAVRYRDDGAPPEVPRMSLLDDAVSAPIGWIEVTPAPDDSLSSHDVKTSDGAVISETAIVGDFIEHAERDVRTLAYQMLGPAEASAARRADAIAVQAARALKAALRRSGGDQVISPPAARSMRSR